MRDFINLDRQFVSYDENVRGEVDHSHYFYGVSFYSSKTWGDILAEPCTVIIAEGGNGKTYELQHQALELRKAGKQAFFANLALLANNRLQSAIETGREEFPAWLISEERGYFFLDAVDEAKLETPQAFHQAILNLLEAIGRHKDRCTVVISTRPHAWQAYADRAFLAARLGQPPRKQAATSALGEASDDDEEDTPAAGEAEATEVESPTINVLQLAPLDESRVRTYATKRGVTDVDAFIEEIIQKDAVAFATRPADLPMLIKIWQDKKRIGSYSEVVRGNIDLKLSESNEVHKTYSIANSRALEGAEMLAAAATLARRTAILVPDQKTESGLYEHAIEPASVLSDWPPKEVVAPLGRALFDEALYGTVRVHHRTAREYLTASWFRRLLKARKHRREVERILFTVPVGRATPIVTPSMKPIVGWLAGWDQRIRDKALHVDPMVLLEHGDAAALDLDTRARLLREFACRYEKREHTPLELNNREVRRLASPALVLDIRALLERYRGHHDVRQLLLRIIREGGLQGLSDLTCSIGLDKALDEHTRSLAIQASAKCGTPSDQKKLAANVVKEAARLDHQILASAVENFWPAHLGLKDIIQLIRKCQRSDASSALEHQLEKLTASVTDKNDKLQLLQEVVALLTTPPLHNEDYSRISERYDWLLPFASKLAGGLLDSEPFDEAVLTVMAMGERADHLERYTGGVQKETIGHISKNRNLKHALLWHLISSAQSRKTAPVDEWFIAAWAPSVTTWDAEDGDYFIKQIAQRSLLNDRKVAVSVLLSIYVREGKPPELMDRIHAAVKHEPELAAFLQERITPKPQTEQARAAQKQLEAMDRQHARDERRNQKDRKEAIKALRQEPSKVGDLSIAHEGKVWNRTIWLFDEIRRAKKGSNTRWTVENWKALEPDFGPEVAASFKDFCLAFWRKCQPKLRSEKGPDSRGTPYAVLIGLSGLGMEANPDASWAVKLTEEEAVLAARYALRAQRFSKVVRPTLPCT